MRKRGSSLIYVLIILVPVMILALSLADLTTVDFKVSNHVINSQQAFYNAESGIEYALKYLELNDYPKETKDAERIYFDDSISGNNYADVKINYKREKDKDIFTINSTGHYMGYQKNLQKELSFNIVSTPVKITSSIFNLKRKFMIKNIMVEGISDRVNFYVKPGRDKKQDQDKFLILSGSQTGSSFVESGDNYSFVKNNGAGGGIKINKDSFFYPASRDDNSIPSIKTGDNSGKWLRYGGTDVYYYVSDGDIAINGTIFTNSNDSTEFLKGLKQYSSSIRVIFVKGNVTLENIFGNVDKKNTLAGKYMNNLLIYSTGSLTIKNVDFQSGASGNSGQSDINICFIANELKVSGINTISYVSGNDGLLYQNQKNIENLITQNIISDIDWE